MFSIGMVIWCFEEDVGKRVESRQSLAFPSRPL